MADKETLKYEGVELGTQQGRLRTAVDPTQLGKGDFQELSNCRYTDAGIRGIRGMSEINNTPVDKVLIRAGSHFSKDQPSESHIIVQGYSPDMSTSALYDSTDTVPNAATFSSIFTESAGADVGRFTTVPDGCVAYGNGEDMLIWGGRESRCAGFVVADTDDSTTAPTALYDYTNDVANRSQDRFAKLTKRYLHVSATRKLKGIKLYVKTANTNIAATIAVKYWNGTSWTAVSNMADGTKVGGKTLTQTGTISFDSTVNVAKVRYFNSQVVYWYLIDLGTGGTAVSLNTEVYYCTIDAPIQPVIDLWDGTPRQIVSFLWWDNGKKNHRDYSVQVFKKDAQITPGLNDVSQTFVKWDGINTDDYLLCGFTERMSGLRFTIVPEKEMDKDITLTVSYWNGAAWVALTARDGTFSDSGTMAQNGVVFWTPPPFTSEFKKPSPLQDFFYYYKLTFSGGTGDGGPWMDCIEGIPAQVDMDTYKFPVAFQNRVALCNNQDSAQNSVLISSSGTNNVFNGTDSTILYFGDDKAVVAAKAFFSRFSNNFYENLLVCKADSVFVVDGFSPQGDANGNGKYMLYRVASMYGCSAPHSMVSCDIGFSGMEGTSATRGIVIWQSATCIVMWDGSAVYPISLDIDDVFDQTKSYAIEPTMVSKSTAFYDEKEREYHWLWASKGSTTLNKEYVFDLIRKKWYTIDRGADKQIQIGFSVADTNNNRYTYGSLDTGKLMRLENGQTFDGEDIEYVAHTGDIPLGAMAGGWMMETAVRKVRPLLKAKNTTTSKLKITHYVDTSSTGRDVEFEMSNAGGRLAKPHNPVESISEENGTFHSFKMSLTTDNEDVGFEPIGIGILYEQVRLKVK